MSKPIAEMTLAEVEHELAWRLKAQEQMVGSLYPAINADAIGRLRARQQELTSKEV